MGGGTILLRWAVCLLTLLLLHSAALAEKGVALLIGNEAYASVIGRLANPRNDVALLEQALKGLDFEVVTVRDAGLGALTRAVNAYARRLQAAGPNAIGFFYYSGHGASDGTTNYLIPVDVKTTETAELWDQSLRLTEITRKLKTEASNATYFVVFDACRNTLKLTQPGSRAVVQSKGFVPVAQENGMLIAYATAEGELASDVGSGAGPYAKVLVEEVVKPGIEAVTMFRNVQRRVRTAIRQEPYLGFSALGDVYLAGKFEQPAVEASKVKTNDEVIRQSREEWRKRNEKEFVVAHYQGFDHACRIYLPRSVDIVKRPKYGIIEMRVEEGTIGCSFTESSKHCIGKKGQARFLYYVLNDKDRDSTAIETIITRVHFPNGSIREFEYEINLAERTSTRTRVSQVRMH